MRGRRKIISSRTKTGWLVNPCRHLSQHANSRLEWLAGTIAQGLLVRPTYSSGHGIMYHARERKRGLEPSHHCRAPLDSRVLHVHPEWISGHNTWPGVSWRRILVTFCSLKKTCTGSGVITYDKLASSRGQYRLVKRKKWHENRYTWLGTIFRCFCIISGHASLQRFLRSYLFARFSRPLLIAFMQIYFKNGGGRSGTTSVLTTNIFPRNSRATFRSSYSVGNFWGTCRRICGRKIFFDYFERFDRFNRLAVVGSGIHLIFYSDLIYSLRKYIDWKIFIIVLPFRITLRIMLR